MYNQLALCVTPFVCEKYYMYIIVLLYLIHGHLQGYWIFWPLFKYILLPACFIFKYRILINSNNNNDLVLY